MNLKALVTGCSLCVLISGQDEVSVGSFVSEAIPFDFSAIHHPVLLVSSCYECERGKGLPTKNSHGLRRSF